MTGAFSEVSALTSRLHELVSEHPDFEVLGAPTFDGYCFRYLPNGLAERQDPHVQALLDHINEEIITAVQREGLGLVRPTRVDGRVAMRMLIESDSVLLEEVDTLFEAIARWGQKLKTEFIRRDTTPDMEGHKCLNESHSSSMEVSAI
jgi:glutamate/tyrosine decarboxylase-like PLP-dependent enzyme